jgi:hypothetical protein
MGAWQEIVDFTFTANETSRTFSGLSITKDDFVKVVFNFKEGANSTTNVALYPNTAAGVSGFNTATNYHGQQIRGSGTSVAAERENINYISVAELLGNDYSLSYVKLSENGKFNIFTNYYRLLDSGVQNRFRYVTSSNLTFNDPITSLTFTASVTNGLGTGSRIQIYKLAAEKVADITVGSNTTQVDISSLSIDKDSEYLLVANWVATGGDCFLTPNDFSTLTSYYSQRIMGDGSSAIAARINQPRFLEGGNVTPNEGISYVHIKLSNIGAFTAQSYTIRDGGLSSLRLQNYFLSSTAENITSITKLNIFAGVDQILAGSRFTLYKLYE